MRKEKTFNIHISKIEKVPTPLSIREEISTTDTVTDLILKTREEVENIVSHKDERLLAVIGPCSIHDPEAALEYAKNLKKLSEKVKDKILIVMRVYFEKPRTTIGWKGLIKDPHLNGTYDVAEGLRIARKLLRDITNLGLPCGTEMLDPVVPQFTADLISWAAIGARTSESQTHRDMVSGLSMPVGFKNSTEGRLDVAINAIEASFHEQSFLGINQEEGVLSAFHTTGNRFSHIVLRGSRDKPNYSEEDIKATEKQLETAGVTTGIMVDCSHGNSNKDPEKQKTVLKSIIKQKLNGNKSIMGFMLESNINAGNQPILEDKSKLEYGVSITDKCMDWKTTEELVLDAYEKLKSH